MKPVVAITKTFYFEAAHFLPNHSGLCKNIHGHSYILNITLTGPIKDDNGDSDEGMIMDFGALKKIVNEKVINLYDHAMVISEKDNISWNRPQKLKVIKKTPTCENMLLDIFESIKDEFTAQIKIKKISLQETATSVAELTFE